MAITIRDMQECEAQASARIACNSPIGKRYALGEESLAKSLLAAREQGDMLFVATLDKTVVGFAWVDPKGAFSSAPYLRLIAVDESFRGQRVGSLLLEAFEANTRHIGRDYLLLVSDFNEGAIRMYEKHGYVQRGSLPGFAREGITELIMVKKREKDEL